MRHDQQRRYRQHARARAIEPEIIHHARRDNHDAKRCVQAASLPHRTNVLTVPAIVLLIPRRAPYSDPTPRRSNIPSAQPGLSLKRLDALFKRQRWRGWRCLPAPGQEGGLVAVEAVEVDALALRPELCAPKVAVGAPLPE